MHNVSRAHEVTEKPNGAAAAALLAAGIGAFVLGMLTTLSDKAVALKNAMVFYRPSGSLSGITTVSIIVWLGAWMTLHFLWRRKDFEGRSVAVVAISLLVLALLLTFPPFIDAI